MGDPRVLEYHESSNNDEFLILWEEVDVAVRSLYCGKAVGIDNIPAELLKHRGETVINIPTIICIKICQTALWPPSWTQ